MDLGQENIEIFMESNKDAFITFVHKSKAAPGTGTYTIKVTQTSSASGDRATNFGVAWR